MEIWRLSGDRYLAAKFALLLVGDKGNAVLAALVEKHCDSIGLVVVGRDPGVANDFADEIIKMCRENDLEVHERPSASGPLDNFAGYKIAIGWRWMLRKSENLIVLHDSLLPRYRGFAPLVNSLINGEERLGVTALFASDEYDQGPVIEQRSISISYPITIFSAIERIKRLYVELVNEIVVKIKNGQVLTATEQEPGLATYSLWRDEADYLLDWSRSAEYLVRFVNAVGYPYDGARTYANNCLVLVREAESVPDVNVESRSEAIGKVLRVDDGCPVVVCASGLIRLKRVMSEAGETLLPLKVFRTRFSSKRN